MLAPARGHTNRACALLPRSRPTQFVPAQPRGVSAFAPGAIRSLCGIRALPWGSAPAVATAAFLGLVSLPDRIGLGAVGSAAGIYAVQRYTNPHAVIEEEAMRSVTVRQYMKQPVISAKPLDTVEHAREMLEKNRINQLPVAVNGGLVGIVTDRDLRDASPSVFEFHEHPSSGDEISPDDPITVESVMTYNVFTTSPDETLAATAKMMREARVGALPVLDDEKLVGIITRSDILEAFVTLAES